VNKFTYGIRLPVVNIKLADINQPRRGEVMVFRYPENRRSIHQAGGRGAGRQDRVPRQAAADQRRDVKTAPDGEYNYVESGLSFVSAKRLLENLDEHRHSILTQQEVPPVHVSGVRMFPSGKIVPTMTPVLRARFRRGIIS